MISYKYIKKAVRFILLGLAGIIVMNTISTLWIYALNKTIEIEFKDGEKTVVFTSGADQLYPMIPNKFKAKIIDFLMYTPITLRQNLEGRHVDWYSHATKQFILEKLSNPDYNNVVFIGHGTLGRYKAADDTLWFYEIDEKVKNDYIKTKNGELIQHTCGITLKEELLNVKEYYPKNFLKASEKIKKIIQIHGDKSIREVLFVSKKGYSNKGIVSPYSNYFRAWIQLYKTMFIYSFFGKNTSMLADFYYW